jgi:hypothetical protein
MKAKHFVIQELVSPNIYDKRGEKAWELINPNLILLIDRIKEKFPMGSMTINNWKWGGNRTESGLRTYTSKNYSPTSQHSLGNAADIIFKEYDTEQVRSYILSNLHEFPEAKRIELGTSWLHIDVANTEYDGIVTFNP